MWLSAAEWFHYGKADDALNQTEMEEYLLAEVSRTSSEGYSEESTAH